MPLFRRRSSSGGPAWVAPLTEEQRGEFRQDVREALSGYGVDDPAFGEGFVLLPGNPVRYELTELVQRWARAEPPDRMKLVLGYFDAAFESLADEASSPEELSPGDVVLHSLRPSVWSSAAVRSVDFPVITRTIADDLEAVLCLDLPSSVATLTPDEAELTRWPMDGLWSVAISRIDDGLPLDVQQHEHEVTAFAGDSLFVASRILELDRFVDALPPHGALVAVPNRHVLLLHPITSVEAVKALNTMIILADRLHREGPASIARHVYWWRRGEMPLRIPSSVVERTVEVTPPDDFVAMLNGLAGD